MFYAMQDGIPASQCMRDASQCMYPAISGHGTMNIFQHDIPLIIELLPNLPHTS